MRLRFSVSSVDFSVKAMILLRMCSVFSSLAIIMSSPMVLSARVTSLESRL
jgi:hypothetical protein